MGAILIVELACATSMYAYKDRLSDGFDKGLNDSMVKYEADDLTIITDFDLMQGKVCRTASLIFAKYDNQYFSV